MTTTNLSESTADNINEQSTGDEVKTLQEVGEMSFKEYEASRKSEKINKAASTGKNVDETPSDSATDNGDKDDADKGDSKTAKSKGDKRFDKLTREKSELEREKDLWKKQALEGKAPTDDKAKTDTKKDTEGKAKPKADDYDTHDAYVEALTDWKLDERLAKQEREAKDTEERKRITKLDEDWKKQKDAARDHYDDFDDVINNEEILVPNIVADTFLNSPIGAHIAYWWGSHPEKVEELIKLSPVALAREMGKIEDRIERQLEAAKEKETIKSTDAQKKEKPAPITPLKGKGNVQSAPDLDDPKIDFKDYEKQRTAEKRNNRR